jgi:hypothetical protein
LVAQRTLSEKLQSALPYHFTEARKYRQFRAEILRDYAGRTTFPGHEKWTLSDEDPEKQIVNLTLQAAEAFVMTFAANTPRFLIEPENPDLEIEGEQYERALNRDAKTIYLGTTLKEIVRDSFALVGIAKVYQASSAVVEAEVDYRMDPGRPYVQRVCFDRFVWDTSATSPETASFMGDFYSIPFREAVKSSRFSAKVRSLIAEMGPETYEEQGDRGEDLARSQNQQSIDDVIYLVDVYVRQPAKIDGQKYRSHVRTYVCDRHLNLKLEGRCVQKVGWSGSECGPYYFLNMGPVPDHFMPSSPGQNQRLLSQLYNTLFRKLEEQARRQKILTTVGRGQSADADTVKDALDGDIIELDEVNAVGQIRFDGPDQNNFGLLVHVGEQHSQANGNLKMKTGAAATADTATQQGMLAAASSQLDAFRKEAYIDFLRDVAKGWSKLIFNDSFLKIGGRYDLGTPHEPISVDDTWPPFGDPSRIGKENQYAVDIDPESTRFQSAAEKLAILDREVQTWLPQIPVLAQFGVQIDVKAYFQERARLSGLPMLNRVFKTGMQPVALAGASTGGGSSSGGPNGQYHHTSSSTRSPESEAMQYMQAPQQQGAA